MEARHEDASLQHDPCTLTQLETEPVSSVLGESSFIQRRSVVCTVWSLASAWTRLKSLDVPVIAIRMQAHVVTSCNARVRPHTCTLA